MTDASTMLRVNEVFGPTIQGEGPTTGRPCTFLRLALCNQTCSWCDTAYTWDWSRFNRDREIHWLQIEETRQRLLECGLKWTNRLVVSGGEPLIQSKPLGTLLEVLPQWVEVETAGTIAPSVELARRVDQWNVSPKLATSGNRLETRRKVDVLRELNRLRSAFKFVVSDAADFQEIEEIQALVGSSTTASGSCPRVPITTLSG